jgi:multiple sugar transport system permease protein
MNVVAGSRTAAPAQIGTGAAGRGTRAGFPVLRKRALTTGTWYVVAGCVALLFAAPLLFGMLDSLKSPTEAVSIPPTYYPHHPTLGNYTSLSIGGIGIDRFFLNSLLVSVATVVCTVLVAGLAGYGFARYPFRGSRAVLLVMLAAIMVPFQVLMVPMYTVLNRLSLTNSLIGVVLVITTFQLPFATFVIQNSFASVPRDLWEAAAVDGAGMWRSLKLALPLVRAGMITAGLFAFFAAWNEFFIVLILLSDEPKYTLPVILTTLLTGTLGSIHWGILDASVVITALPCVIIYVALQRHFVRGVMAGMGR